MPFHLPYRDREFDTGSYTRSLGRCGYYGCDGDLFWQGGWMFLCNRCGSHVSKSLALRLNLVSE